MARYDKKIVNRLLDSYEASTLFGGKNKVAVHIAFPFNKRTIPAYFDESSLAYEDPRPHARTGPAKPDQYQVEKGERRTYHLKSDLMHRESGGRLRLCGEDFEGG